MTFCLASYRDLLLTARRLGYTFGPFADGGPGRRVLLRHDVDYSLTSAVELAQVNAAVGVQGTFCLLLRGEVYNLLSREGTRLARELLVLGQRVGLHYTAPEAGPADDLEALSRAVADDHALLCRHVPGADPVFSWHNPAGGTLYRTADWSPPGLTNAYHRRFVADIPYLSDSNLRNAPANFAAALARTPPVIHLLFHPLNWVVGGATMPEILAGIWPYVLREREAEFRTNRVYQALFPAGMPQPLLDAFAAAWLGAARAAEAAQPPRAA